MAKAGRPRIELDFPRQVLARYAAGEIDHLEVGRLCGVSARVALRELRRAGMDTSRSTRKQLQAQRRFGMANLYENIRKLYSLGLSLREVGDQFGLTQEGVRQILLRHGTQPRSAGSPAAGTPREQEAARQRFARRLQQLRRAASLNQAELAARSNVSRQTISTLERGARLPAGETLARLAEALEVSADVLLAGTGISSSPPYPSAAAS